MDFQPNELKESPEIMKRIRLVKKFRENSGRATTQKLATTPTLFGEIRQPKSTYILIPKISSENRKYIPMGFYPPSIIASGSCLNIPKADIYTFGVLTSAMHMTWTKYICGRMKSDYQYSASIVYNNFPWTNGIPKRKKDAVENAAQKVIDIRHEYLSNGSSLAKLYDNSIMPHELLKAHQTLDKAVDKCYRDAPFTTDTKRIEFLFDLYDTYTSGMFPEE